MAGEGGGSVTGVWSGTTSSPAPIPWPSEEGSAAQSWPRSQSYQGQGQSCQSMDTKAAKAHWFGGKQRNTLLTPGPQLRPHLGMFFFPFLPGSPAGKCQQKEGPRPCCPFPPTCLRSSPSSASSFLCPPAPALPHRCQV